MISCVAIIAIIAFLFGWIIQVQIGGQTGDTCGAAQLISETVGYIFLVTFLNI
jgi:cobalamin synthase